MGEHSNAADDARGVMDSTSDLPEMHTRKKARPCGAAPLLVSVAFRSRSEVELGRQLNDAMTLLIRGNAEERVIRL